MRPSARLLNQPLYKSSSHLPSHSLSIRQFDISNAFLHGNISEEVYMAQPPGFVDPSRPSHVCRLHCSIYGLKQTPHTWFQRLWDCLLLFGFMESKADASLFILHTHSTVALVLVYIDDIIVTGSTSDVNYALGLLKRTNMLDAKPCSTPMAANTQLVSDSTDLFADPSLNRQVVGALQYLMVTRPDLSFLVNNKVSQFVANPSNAHWAAVKRILRYVKHTPSLGITFTRSSSMQLYGFSDLDWASYHVDRRSHGGFYVFLGSNLISWSSTKHSTISRFSTEAKY
ncbi:PREDICTED: uncharacterized protein LOC109115957 [Nelumbo nucifera]|uniref:Uncharacterized protein LOC109115957 n=1 Tax=Nelumbo nucifera TaxID=4432 RepID=A0A1U8QBP7_NELNU|nr:PREDICTED: uncharacterized protein LOC109115957 [Nelumbo nucifera]